MRFSIRPKLVLVVMALAFAATGMAIGVEAADVELVPTAPVAQEDSECAPLTPAIVSNEYFEVVDASTVRFREGVEFELVEDETGNTVVQYLAAGQPIEAIQKLDCNCRPGCYGTCQETIIFPFLALCTGECERHEPEDCAPCRWR